MKELIISLVSASATRVLTGWLFALLRSQLPDPENPEDRPKILRVLWVLAVIALLLVSLVVTGGSWLVLSSLKPGIYLTVALWSIFLGATGLLFLPTKGITAAFGMFFGVSLSEVGNAAGLITLANRQVTDVSIQLGIIVGTEAQSVDPYIASLVWTFVVVVGLLCLPAFFFKD